MHSPFRRIGEHKTVVTVLGKDENIREQIQQGERLLEGAADGFGMKEGQHRHAANIPIFRTSLQ